MKVSAAVALALGALITVLSASCVERTFAPADPLAGLRGTWRGTRHLVVFDSLGHVVPDTTSQRSLVLIIGTKSVTFIDSKEGTLSATVESQTADNMVFTLTNGDKRWSEACHREDRSLTGVETFGSGTSAGVWAVYRDQD